MNNVYEDVVAAIGHTPIVKLNRVCGKSPHTFWAKLEFLNPGGSVKDRIAVSIIEGAEKRGDLKPGGVIIEATSGNTGLGLAMVAASKGYKCIFVMPEKVSEEKRTLLRAYGAEVLITPNAKDTADPNSYLSVSRRLAKETPNSLHTEQYFNLDNVQQHYKTTGPEIWKQMKDRLDVLVAGAGTGGTISGIGHYLKEVAPQVQVILADPVGSIFRDLFYEKKVVSPPGPYFVEGVGQDMLPDNMQLKYLDGVVSVSDQQSFRATRDLVRMEGICVGPSSGMALAAALEWSKNLKKPSNILMIFPDNGRAYLSKAFNDQWLKDNKII